MPDRPRVARKHAAFAYHRTAPKSTLPGNSRMLTDPYVVGDVDEVVESDAVLDNRIIQRPEI